MNYLFISPNFPSNFKNFAICLNARGVKVLGIGSDDYERLEPELQESLADYYKVGNMENYDDMLRACAFLTYRHGRIDRIESHNEHWLELDARLRTDFNVFGDKDHDMERVKLKSGMKAVYRKAEVLCIRGEVLGTKAEHLAFIKEVGYPICAKPDNGVGASSTFKISNEDELDAYLAVRPDVDYMVEEFIEGDIVTFDGLVDTEGRICFSNSFVYNAGVMDIVNQDLDNCYYTIREIPADIRELGERCVDAFRLKERFFHMEFFRKTDGSLVALEINARPPGGQSMDMFNYANDVNLYDQYARAVLGLPFDANVGHPYFCANIGLKVREGLSRRHSREEVLSAYGSLIMEHGPVPEIFSQAMGNYAYILRTPDYEELLQAIEYILEKV